MTGAGRNIEKKNERGTLKERKKDIKESGKILIICPDCFEEWDAYAYPRVTQADHDKVCKKKIVGPKPQGRGGKGKRVFWKKKQHGKKK